MSFKVSLFPAPDDPMITVFWPSGTSSETPLSTLRAPNDLVRFSRMIMTRNTSSRAQRGSYSEVEVTEAALVRRPASQKHQGPERIQHQNRLAAQHHRPRGRLADPFGAALSRQTAQAAHQRHCPAEARALDQTKPNVLEPVE